MDIQRKRERSPDVIADHASSTKRARHNALRPPSCYDVLQHGGRYVTHRSRNFFEGSAPTSGPLMRPHLLREPFRSEAPEVPSQRPDGGVYGLPILSLDWDQIKSDFAWNGIYRTLGVENTTLEHWRHLFNALAEAPLAYALYLDGEQVLNFRHRLEEIFSDEVATRYLLKVELDGAIVHCHLNTEHEMTFYFDAGDIDENEFILLMGFLQLLHTATEQEVFLGDSRARALYLCSEETCHGPLRLL